MTTPSDSLRPNQAVPIVILGTDALLAASPATPVQLAHACLQAGFANAIPASWGDELIAAAVLRRLPQFEGGPAIQCSCPIVAHRLLSVGGDLRPAMLGFVAPPVAIARYARALSGATPVRITYVGACPGANDDAIDIRMRPDALLALLAERDIVIEDQPRVFESILPPDRRRFRSQPGGVPTAESLWSDVGARTLVEMDTDDFVTELAQQLLTGKNILIDAGPHLGCVCSGAIAGVPVKDARAGVVTLEPPRAMMPVVEEQAPIELDLAVPAASRTPVDISAVVAHASPVRGVQAVMVAAPVMSPAASQPLPPPLAGHRFSPVRSMAAIPETKAPSRPSGPANQRSVHGLAPIARDAEGKSLPRAYVARRRPSPRAVPVVTTPTTSHGAHPPRSTRASARATIEATRRSESTVAQASAPQPTPQAPPPARVDTPESAGDARATTASQVHVDTHPTEPSLVAAPVAERSRYEPAKPSPAVAPEPITFFDKVPASSTTREAAPRQTPISPLEVLAEKPRSASRPRPSVTVEPEGAPPVSMRRLLIVGGAVALVLSIVVSIISAIVVTRVFRPKEPAATSTPATPPAKP